MLGKERSKGKRLLVLSAGIVLSLLFRLNLASGIDEFDAGEEPWNLTNTADVCEMNPAWSPDSSKIAYFALEATDNPDNPVKCNLYVISNANTSSPSEPVLVSTGDTVDICEFEEGVAFNKDGDKVVFVIMPEEDGENGEGGGSQIWIANVDGAGSPTMLLGTAGTEYLAISVSWHDPNNKEWLTYVKCYYMEEEEEKFDLLVRELTGTSVGETEITITQLPDFSCDFPKWSYQGDKIAFMKTKAVEIGEKEYERADIYVLNDVQDIIAGNTSAPTTWDDTRLIQITNVMGTAPGYEGGIGAIMPNFSYDGTKVFYSIDLNGNFALSDLETGGDFANAFNRNDINDDDELVEFDMYIADATKKYDEQTTVKFDNQAYNQSYLNMSPDGMWLSYIDDRDGNADVFVVPIRSVTTCGTAGGTADSLDGSGISVSSQTVDADTDFSVYKPKLTAEQESGTPFCVREFGPAGTSFETPVEITIHYTDEELGSYDEDNLYIVKWNDSISEWEEVIGTATIDKTNNTITISASRFSTYGVEGFVSTAVAVSGGEDRCFIATAAYGTPLAEEVKSLREFRDNILIKTTAGRDFVELYYKTSPPVADFIRNKPALKAIVRIGLKPLVWLSRLIK